MKEFRTRKLNVAKEMLRILGGQCECRLSEDGQDKFEFVFPYNEEVFNAYAVAKDRIYKE